MIFVISWKNKWNCHPHLFASTYHLGKSRMECRNQNHVLKKAIKRLFSIESVGILLFLLALSLSYQRMLSSEGLNSYYSQICRLVGILRTGQYLIFCNTQETRKIINQSIPVHFTRKSLTLESI